MFLCLQQEKDWKGKLSFNLPSYCDPNTFKSCTWDDGVVVKKWTTSVHARKCGKAAALALLSAFYDIKCNDHNTDPWNTVIGAICSLFEVRSDEFRDDDLAAFLTSLAFKRMNLVAAVLKTMIEYKESEDNLEERSSWLLNPTLFCNLISPSTAALESYFDVVLPEINDVIVEWSKRWQGAQITEFLLFLLRKLTEFADIINTTFSVLAQLLLELMNRDWNILEKVLSHHGDSAFDLLLKCSLANVPGARDLSVRAAQFSKGRWIQLTLSELSSALSSDVRSFWILRLRAVFICLLSYCYKRARPYVHILIAFIVCRSSTHTLHQCMHLPFLLFGSGFS